MIYTSRVVKYGILHPVRVTYIQWYAPGVFYMAMPGHAYSKHFILTSRYLNWEKRQAGGWREQRCCLCARWSCSRCSPSRSTSQTQVPSAWPSAGRSLAATCCSLCRAASADPPGSWRIPSSSCARGKPTPGSWSSAVAASTLSSGKISGQRVVACFLSSTI